MSVRVEVVTPCEHDQWNPHRSGDGEIVASSDGAEIMAVICRGASRKAFTEWPPEAIEAAAKAADAQLYGTNGFWDTEGRRLPRESSIHLAEKVLAAVWGHITGKDE